MDLNARDSYLEGQVMTATPQKLRLLLVEGALRFARQTLSLWDEGKDDEALETLIRCRGIVSELLASVRPDDSDLTRKVAGVYVFLFQRLTEAQHQHDAKRIREVMEVLEVERETWTIVCEKLPEAPQPIHEEAKEITAADFPQSTVQGLPGADDSATSGGLVLDA